MMAVVTERRNLGIVGFLKGVEGKYLFIYFDRSHVLWDLTAFGSENADGFVTTGLPRISHIWGCFFKPSFNTQINLVVLKMHHFNNR